MLRNVILGLLRDGRERHGYDMIVEYRARTGLSPSAGNFYRELGRLTELSLVEHGVNPPGADARRIPYRISPRGCLRFDQWLGSGRADRDLWERLLFLNRIPSADRARMLRRQEAALMAEADDLRRAAANSRPRGRFPSYELAPLLRARRLRLIDSEVQFVREARESFEAWLRSATPGRLEDAPPARGIAAHGG